MAGKTLSDLVSDWGGFERLVAQLHETGSVTVEHNVTLPGRSGAPRQIDVLVRHKEGLYEHLIVVECKYRNAPIERLHVDALATTIREVGASRGVIFSTEGFQSGAIDQARHEGISLFRLREPTDVEWGLPGRHVDIWLHIISTALGAFEMPVYPFGLPPTRPLKLDIRLGFPDNISATPIKVADQNDTTLEELVLRLANVTTKLAYKPLRLDFNGSFDGETKRVIRVNFAPEKPMLLLADGHTLIVPRISFRIGLKINQSRLLIDRGEKYGFVLAVEDCVKNLVTTASRSQEEQVTQLADLKPPTEASEAIYQNGSIITVKLKSFEQFSEFDGIEPSGGSEMTMKLSDIEKG
ncbi:MAG: restriction endonuclease [Reyranella sp.]|uniref:restriction endonuclease n=1 Tax=Reyranella sp. TaxID=1929291 RepID=UPI001214C196|nr:restriction endonuclease [Reyranella sp.]TAJ42432.1 MAG: restriction endonuclease [Reyranella sp.]